MTIGFVGLGNMGLPMARRLLGAGHRLLVFDTDDAAVERATAHGARAASSAVEVANTAETVLSSLGLAPM